MGADLKGWLAAISKQSAQYHTPAQYQFSVILFSKIAPKQDRDLDLSKLCWKHGWWAELDVWKNSLPSGRNSPSLLLLSSPAIVGTKPALNTLGGTIHPETQRYHNQVEFRFKNIFDWNQNFVSDDMECTSCYSFQDVDPESVQHFILVCRSLWSRLHSWRWCDGTWLGGRSSGLFTQAGQSA